MTKAEFNKCEKLMYEAITKARQAQEEYETAYAYLKVKNRTACMCENGKANQHYGEAVGINQVLSVLGFKHEEMKTLADLL